MGTTEWNLRHRKFIEDHNCYDCDYFGTNCVGSTGDEGFKCSLEDTQSDIYKDFVVKNFIDLCDIVEEPSIKTWQTSVNKGTRFSNLYATRKLMCSVWMPKTEILQKFENEFGQMENGENVLCIFSILQLHKRVREMLLYTPKGKTISNSIARQLIDLLIPLDYQYLFTFEGNK